MDVGSIFIAILTVISDALTQLFSLLPNPDPFPEIIESIDVSGVNAVGVAYYWLDQFFIADAVINIIGLWFLMFPIAWIIMMLWKWLKAR